MSYNKFIKYLKKIKIIKIRELFFESQRKWRKNCHLLSMWILQAFVNFYNKNPGEYKSPTSAHHWARRTNVDGIFFIKTSLMIFANNSKCSMQTI